MLIDKILCTYQNRKKISRSLKIESVDSGRRQLVATLFGIGAVVQPVTLARSDVAGLSSAQLGQPDESGSLDAAGKLLNGQLNFASTAAASAGTDILKPVNSAGAGAAASSSPFSVAGSTTRRSNAARWADRVNVKDFGAVGDGVTDNYAAFTAAYVAAKTLAPSGCAIFIPPGQYLISGGTVVLDRSGYGFAGEGAAGTRVVNGMTSAPALQLGTGSKAVNRQFCRDISFGGAVGVTGAAGQCGLKIYNANNPDLDRIEILPYPAALYDGLVCDTFNSLFVDEIGIQGCMNRGAYFANGVDFYPVSVRCDGNRIGVQFVNVQGVYGGAVTAYHNTVYGIHLMEGGTRVIRNWLIHGWVADTSGHHNWMIEELQNAKFVNCWGCSQSSVTENKGACGFYFTGEKTSFIKLIACTAANNNADGISYQASAINGTSPGSIEQIACDFGEGLILTQGNGRAGTGYGFNVGVSVGLVKTIGGNSVGNASGPFANIASNVIVTQLTGFRQKYIHLAKGITDTSGEIITTPGLSFNPTYYFPVPRPNKMSNVFCTMAVAGIGASDGLANGQVKLRFSKADGTALANTAVAWDFTTEWSGLSVPH